MRTAVFTIALAALLPCACASSDVEPERVRRSAAVAHERALDLEAVEPGVVVMALATPQRDELAGAAAPAPMSITGLLKLQIELASRLARNVPVILVTDQYETMLGIVGTSAWGAELAALVDEGSVRLVTVGHETPWIRDYGPRIVRRSGAGVVMVDPRYYDVRAEYAARDALGVINQGRVEQAVAALELLDQRDGHEELSPLRGELTPEHVQEALDDVRERLYLLGELSSAMEGKGFVRRASDDRSPYEITQTVLEDRAFEVQRTDLSVDGGNVLRLSDGRLLTSTDTLSRNYGREAEVTATLPRLYGASEIVYLAPLPGPVIKHVDMFVLPATGNRVLLGWYDPEHPALRDSWARADTSLRPLILEADRAMRRNRRELRARGYDVVEVPAPYPALNAEGSIYYPSVLNALSVRDARGGLHVAVPVYKGADAALQDAAVSAIRSAFGADTDVFTIESTAAGEAQGAIHCLTIAMPADLVPFAAGHPAAAR